MRLLLHMRTAGCRGASGRHLSSSTSLLKSQPSFLRRGGGDRSAPPRARVLSNVTYDVSPVSREDRKALHSVSLPPLKCPGGPRMKSEGLKQLYKVPHAGILAQYGYRNILNLKLTHQIATKLSRCTLKQSEDKVLLELGPGAGALTRSLLTRPLRGVLGVERDSAFNPHLEQIRGYTKGKFQWVNADVLEVDEVALLQHYFPTFVRQNRRRAPHQAEGRDSECHGEGSCTFHDTHAPLRSAERDRLLRKRHTTAIIAAETSTSSEHSGTSSFQTSPNPAFDIQYHWWSDGDSKLEVVANLPFDTITELLMRYAVDCSRRSGLFIFGRVPLHLFVQKEIADIITAPPGSVHFSRLTVLANAFFHVQLHQVFTETTYYPRTEVLGALLTLQPRSVPLTHRHGGSTLDGAALIQFTDLLMRPGQRGATLQKALPTLMPPEVAQYILQEGRLDGSISVLDTTVEEMTGMAALWTKFLIASQQQRKA